MSEILQELRERLAGKWVGTFSGIIRASGGSGFEGVTVTLWAQALNDRRTVAEYRCRTDAAGRFSVLDAVFPAYYVLDAESDALGIRHTDELTMTESPMDIAVEVTPKLTVRGIVRDENGDVIEGAWVRCAARGVRGRARAISDDRGRFRVRMSQERLRNAESLMVTSASPRHAASRVDLTLNPSTPIHEMTMTLRRVGVVRGVVLDEQNRPMPEQEVQLKLVSERTEAHLRAWAAPTSRVSISNSSLDGVHRQIVTAKTSSDAEGRFEFPRRISADSGFLVIEREGRRPLIRRIAGGALEANSDLGAVVLPGDVPIEVLFRRSDGSLLAGVRVRFHLSHPALERVSVKLATGPDGRVVSRFFELGRSYRVWVGGRPAGMLEIAGERNHFTYELHR